VGTNRNPPTLVVPIGEEIRFSLTSRDVIHAFWIPSLRFKRDAFPGRQTLFGLSFARAGVHRGVCAEFCGLHHADMSFRVRAVPRARFEAATE
jgi:cytochrome c oxidase subunit 2